MAPNKDQPRQEVKANVARLAKVHRLKTFDDISLIDEFAARYGQHPNDVFDNTDFGTLTYLTIKWKESAEYQERYQHIWHEINQTPAK